MKTARSLIAGLLLLHSPGCDAPAPSGANASKAAETRAGQPAGDAALSAEPRVGADPGTITERTAPMAHATPPSRPEAPTGAGGQVGDAAPRHTNRLIDETSPYLLQHAHNPVDWFAWGPEAFEAARTQDKPIFLSIGYSTCYWCHVMERESFENKDVAAILNDHFICIKVDREERPDVDDIYMAAVQEMGQRGGWPLSVFLEPAGLRPFFIGTYFPPEDAFGRVGFKSILRQLAGAWRERRPEVLDVAERVGVAVRRLLAGPSESRPLTPASVDIAVDRIAGSYDRRHGGYGPAPKFPMPANLDFLLDVAWSRRDVRESVIHTLDRMAMGGMYDQVGGGFHRYSTDGQWLVPHFEKMLYDNGQLASTYAEAYARTGDAYYAEVIREVLDYVLREMTDQAGGFHSAQDAEVDGREGLNYIWEREEFEAALRAAGLEGDIEFALRVYGLDGQPNFQDPHHPEDGRKYIVHLVDRPHRLAAALEMDLDAFEKRLLAINAALLAVRDQRKQPRLDDKIIAGWNGLMIGGFADGGRALGEPKYIEAAGRAAAFVLTEMRAQDGGLYRTHRAGESKISAFAEDYALMIGGLLALHRAAEDARKPAWLDEAIALAGEARERFWDASAGGFFDTLPEQSDLFVRTKSRSDGAMPCANSAMINNLLDLHEITGERRWLDDAAATLRSMSEIIAGLPHGPVLATMALNRFAQEYPGAVGLEGQGDIAEAAAPRAVGDEAVTVRADVASVSLAMGDRATIVLSIEIAQGFHINAHEPGPEFLIPLKIELTGGEGLRADIAYPEGEVYVAAAISDAPMRVHTGSIEIPVGIERTGEITGTPQLVITWQACTDRACLLPKTMALPVGIEGK